MVELPPEAWLCALSELDRMGPARLNALLEGRSPAEAWAAAGAGAATPPRTGAETVAAWRRGVRRTDVAEVWARYRRAGVGVVGRASGAMPLVLRDDLEPPAVLFHQGDPRVVSRPRVAIVGTRQCTRYGAEFAHHLGRVLADTGVGVVSGLAAGIDGFAHRGALRSGATPPIAVVGTGLDVVYPADNADLWAEVAAAGVVLGEAPLGAQPLRWRFPARNRLIAALADIVVVVESHERGGSMHTVAEAIDRGRPVMAVPGPVRSPASRGTNRLLAEGCAPVCDPDDIVMALGLEPGGLRSGPSEPADSAQRAVLDACGWLPVTFDEVADHAALPLAELAVAVEELLGAGHLARRGMFLERVAEPREKPPMGPALG